MEIVLKPVEFNGQKKTGAEQTPADILSLGALARSLLGVNRILFIAVCRAFLSWLAGMEAAYEDYCDQDCK